MKRKLIYKILFSLALAGSIALSAIATKHAQKIEAHIAPSIEHPDLTQISVEGLPIHNIQVFQVCQRGVCPTMPSQEELDRVEAYIEKHYEIDLQIEVSEGQFETSTVNFDTQLLEDATNVARETYSIPDEITVAFVVENSDVFGLAGGLLTGNNSMFVMENEHKFDVVFAHEYLHLLGHSHTCWYNEPGEMIPSPGSMEYGEYLIDGQKECDDTIRNIMHPRACPGLSLEECELDKTRLFPISQYLEWGTDKIPGINFWNHLDR